MTPRQCECGRSDATLLSRPSNVPFVPHATTTRSTALDAAKIYVSFSAPTGSATKRRAFGSVDRYAKRFTNTRLPNPQSFAKPMQRRTVLSSFVSSAVEGLSPTNITAGSVSSQIRDNVYRYVRHGEKNADLSIGPYPSSVTGVRRKISTQAIGLRQQRQESGSWFISEDLINTDAAIL